MVRNTLESKPLAPLTLACVHSVRYVWEAGDCLG